jgi:hypothetical protein
VVWGEVKASLIAIAAPPLHSAEQHESIHGQLTPVPRDSPDYIPPV